MGEAFLCFSTNLLRRLSRQHQGAIFRRSESTHANRLTVYKVGEQQKHIRSAVKARSRKTIGVYVKEEILKIHSKFYVELSY